jgi:predicted RNA-binding protein with PIN domain
VAEPTLYLFDGFNLLHAGGFESPAALRDVLASWVAAKGARGVLVFDGTGEDESHGPLEVRWAPHADTLLERLAAEQRSREQVAVVSSDAAVRGTAGGQVRKLSSQSFLEELALPRYAERGHGDLRDRLDAATLAELDRLRREVPAADRPGIERKRLDAPDRRQVFLDGSERVAVEVGDALIGRGVYKPGWRWSEHVGPLVGAGSAAHTGYVLSGRMAVRAPGGEEMEIGPREAFWVGPGHDAWVVGDEPCVAIDFARL